MAKYDVPGQVIVKPLRAPCTMPTYLVSPQDQTDWHEDAQAFASALKAQWAGAQVTEDPPESTMVLSFEFEEQSERVLGRLHRDGQAVILDADVPAAAAIAAWWRGRVPEEVALIFYDEGYSADVPVEPGADGAAVATAYLAAANP